METTIQYIDRFIVFFGTKDSLANNLAKAVAVLFVTFLLWLVIKRILTSLENRSVTFRFLQVRKEVFAVSRKMSGLVLIWLVGLIWIRLLQVAVIENILHAVFILFAAGPIRTILIVLLEVLERNLAERTETNLDNIVIDLLNKFSGAIVYATAAVIALDVLGVNVMPFIAGAGVLGVAVGFAAKDTLSNLIAGILLIIDRPFEIGDRIEVWSVPTGNASWGDVIDIGLRATRIKTTDNIVVIIPNNEIMTRDIVNYTSISTSIRVRINIGIAYDADLPKAKNLIVEAARSADWILTNPAPKVVVRNFGESSVDLQARVWIRDARRRMDTIDYITDTVKTLFDENGIEIPFPKRDITIVNRPAGTDPAPKKMAASLD
jgi:small-conductance mechanosensitive channel